jgi:hypothetical protein
MPLRRRTLAIIIGNNEARRGVPPGHNSSVSISRLTDSFIFVNNYFGCFAEGTAQWYDEPMGLSVLAMQGRQI